MSSNLKVNTILPSTGSNVAIGTAGGTVTIVGNVDIDINSGISTFNDIHISDKIVHDGDTNTSLRFPAADTITAETGGTERIRIDSSGRLLLGTTTEGYASADDLTVATTGSTGITIRSGTGSLGTIAYSDGTSGDAEYRGYLQYAHNGDFLKIGTAGAEKLRIDSSGRVLINTTNNSNGHIAASNLAVQGGDFTIFKDSGGDNAGVSGHKLKFVTQSGSLGEIDVLSEGGGGPSGRGGAMRFYTKANNTASATERLRIGSDGLLTATGNADFNVAGGELDIYSTGSGDQLSLRLLNSDASAGNKIGIYFGPANNVAGAYIKGVAESDFTSAANRDAGLEFGTRLNATFLAPLKISAAGYVTKPNQPMFASQGSGDAMSAQSPLPYDSIVYNIGSHWNNSTYKFLCPVAGYYYVTCHVVPTGFANNNQNVELYIKNNAGTRYFLDRKVKTTNYSSNNFSVGGSRIVYAAANDNLWVEFNSISGSPTLESSSHLGIMLMA